MHAKRIIKQKYFEFKASLYRIYKQVIKEFKIVRTDYFNLFIALVLPPLIIMLFAFMTARSTETIVPIKVTIVSNDSKEYINETDDSEIYLDDYADKYLDAVKDTKSLELVDFYDAEEEDYAMEKAREDLRDSKIKCIIVIPVEFTEFLLTEEPGVIECVPDSSKAIYIQDTLNAVQDSIDEFVDDNDLEPEYVEVEVKEYSIPSNYNLAFNYNMTFLFPFMVFGISTVLTILVVVQEKPIARLLLTPTKKYEILLSKFVTYTIILAIQIALILTSALLNGLYVAGSVFDLYIALFMVGFTGICLGMFISTVSKTKTEANQLFFAFFIVIILLSGIFVPLEAMPEYLQAISYILPLSHGEPMITAILSKGKSVVGFDFFCLLGLSAFFILLSFLIIYRKRYEV